MEVELPRLTTVKSLGAEHHLYLNEVCGGDLPPAHTNLGIGWQRGSGGQCKAQQHGGDSDGDHATANEPLCEPVHRHHSFSM